jgi:DNA repair protein RadC
MRIAGLPEGERPRERCLRLGAGALSAGELLALLLGGGRPGAGGLALAQALLERFGSLKALARVNANELAAVKGVGAARSTALAAAFELGRRAARAPVAAQECVQGPADAAHILAPLLEELGQEAVAVLCLGARNQVLRMSLVALGGLNAAGVEPREVFRGAIAVGAAALVLAHNHPSGCAEPSEDDVRLTRRLAACGETLGIKLLDHLVLGDGTYTSLRERGAF